MKNSLLETVLKSGYIPGQREHKSMRPRILGAEQRQGAQQVV